MRKLERVRPKPASLSDNLGSCVAIAISSSSKGFSLPFFTPPYPTALSGFGTPSLPSQSLSPGRLAWGPFQQHCHSHSATEWKAELSHPLAACPGAKRTLAQHQVPSGNQRLGPSLVLIVRFQARRVGSQPFPVPPAVETGTSLPSSANNSGSPLKACIADPQYFSSFPSPTEAQNF